MLVASTPLRRASFHRTVELLGPSEAPGRDGLRMTVPATEGPGQLRLWLRRHEPWDRAIDPRALSATWDLRVHVRADSAMALLQEFTVQDLDTLVEGWAWPERPEAIGQLRATGDALHDRVLAWVWKVTGWGELPPPGQAPAPARVKVVADVEPLVGESGWDDAEEAAERYSGQFAAIASEAESEDADGTGADPDAAGSDEA